MEMEALIPQFKVLVSTPVSDDPSSILATTYYQIADCHKPLSQPALCIPGLEARENQNVD